jgi:hypothetical protein
MTSTEITNSVALSLAIERAKSVLGELFPTNEVDVFEELVIRDKNFWLFFRNRDISVPEYPNGEISDNCAFAVGKHGLTLTVEDNFDNEQKLNEQIKGLSQYFSRRDR